MSLPWTTRLSLDFFRSMVSISASEMSAHVESYIAWLRTVTTKLEIEHIADPDIDNSKESLVPSLELALVKDLNCDDGGVFDHTRMEIKQGVVCGLRWGDTDMSKDSFQ